MKLKDMVTISSGSIKFEEQNNSENSLKKVLLVNAVNLSDLGVLELGLEGDGAHVAKSVYVTEELYHSKGLKAGDILFMSRGSNLRAGIVREIDTEHALIPSQNFLVIRAGDKILPEVIVAYLNSEKGQAELDALCTGAALRHISLSKMKEFQIDLPEKAIQTQIATLFLKNVEVLQSLTQLYQQQERTFEAVTYQLFNEGK